MRHLLRCLPQLGFCVALTPHFNLLALRLADFHRGLISIIAAAMNKINIRLICRRHQGEDGVADPTRFNCCFTHAFVGQHVKRMIGITTRDVLDKKREMGSVLI